MVDRCQEFVLPMAELVVVRVMCDNCKDPSMTGMNGAMVWVDWAKVKICWYHVWVGLDQDWLW